MPASVVAMRQAVVIDYTNYFPAYIRKAIALEIVDKELGLFNLPRMAAVMATSSSSDRRPSTTATFCTKAGIRFELPQAFFMRVAMGLAVREIDREAKAIGFYQLLSSFDFMCSTPTLFNAGTLRPQLSSCFLTTIEDDLAGIFKAIKDNALLSKYAGGVGNDWSGVRGLGSHIKGTNGQSQGLVPYLKVANDTVIAVNQGGKRKGAVCDYLETWHIDIEEFLDLRKNTSDDRRHAHDMNTANWVPDLFMQRVEESGAWTLFSPDEAPDLHDLYGRAFAERYAHYEAATTRGEMRVFRTLKAVDLWRKMLTMIFETGHPWITFKDPCNLHSPQQHVGVVHSSNLCTGITLNTSAQEIAVCNLGSVNLANHMTPAGLDQAHLRRTVHTAMRMLDNVIDINFYTMPEARVSNLRHRPVGLGIMGYQNTLYQMRIPFTSPDAANLLCLYLLRSQRRHRTCSSLSVAGEKIPSTVRAWCSGCDSHCRTDSSHVAGLRTSSALPVNLYCVQDGTGPVRWVTAVRKHNVSLIPDLMRVGGFTCEPHPEMVLPWVSKQAPLYSSRATTAGLPGVNLQILEQSMSGSTLCVHAHLNAPPEVDRISSSFHRPLPFKAWSSADRCSRTYPAGRKRFSTTIVHGGNEVSFCLDARGNTDLYLTAVKYGFLLRDRS